MFQRFVRGSHQFSRALNMHVLVTAFCFVFFFRFFFFYKSCYWFIRLSEANVNLVFYLLTANVRHLRLNADVTLSPPPIYNLISANRKDFVAFLKRPDEKQEYILQWQQVGLGHLYFFR